MIPVIIMVLAALVGVWLLKRTQCINTRFIQPPVRFIDRVRMWKTRRGWIAGNVAINADEGPMEEDEKDALLRECFDLDPEASDDDVREAANAFRSDDKAENAKRIERQKAAFNALGLADDATADDFHEHVLAVPAWLKELRDEAANAKKAAAKALLDLAINTGHITQADRAGYEVAFNADFDATAKKLQGEKKKLNTQQLAMNTRKPATSNLIELGEQAKQEANKLLEEKKVSDWATAWNTVKKDKRFAEYFQSPKPEAAVA